MYYRGAAAAVIVYDITSASSFERAKSWVKEIQRQGNNDKCIIAICGNKLDLQDKREVPAQVNMQNYIIFFLVGAIVC